MFNMKMPGSYWITARLEKDPCPIQPMQSLRKHVNHAQSGTVTKELNKTCCFQMHTVPNSDVLYLDIISVKINGSIFFLSVWNLAAWIPDFAKSCAISHYLYPINSHVKGQANNNCLGCSTTCFHNYHILIKEEIVFVILISYSCSPCQLSFSWPFPSSPSSFWVLFFPHSYFCHSHSAFSHGHLPFFFLPQATNRSFVIFRRCLKLTGQILPSLLLFFSWVRGIIWSVGGEARFKGKTCLCSSLPQSNHSQISFHILFTCKVHTLQSNFPM